MPKLQKILLNVLMLSSLVACSGNLSSDFSNSLLESSKPVQTGRFLIKSAALEIEVEDPEHTTNEINMIVSRYSGYVDNVHDRDQKRISMIVKIPEKGLDQFIEEVSSLGKLISKSLSSRDVTEEMVDIKSRLVNLVALRDRFRTLLDKALNVSDVLQIERELSRIQTEIDSIEARRKSLKNQVALSKVNINISQKTVYGPLGYIGKGLYWFVEKLFVIR